MILSVIKNFIRYKILGKTSDIKTDTLNISFKKKNNRWYADLPSWTGAFAQLEMVCGADDLLEELSDNKDRVSLTVSTEPFENAIELMQIYHNYCGAGYKLINSKYKTPEIWLCNVTHFVLGEHPKTLYFKK